MRSRNICTLIITFSLLICNSNVISANSEVEEKSIRNPIFGGLIIEPTENYNNSEYAKDLPSIAHIITATWCAPCVEVEHAIEDVANETDVVMLTFHRFAGETEDPFGSENAENWWKEWFNEERPLQPTAIINGGDSLIGASQGSYENIYDEAIKKPNLKSDNQDDDPIIHISFDSNSSEFVWEISNANKCDEVKTFVNFVEDVAYFPNGSNGLDNYTHIVHHVKEMPGASGATDLSQTLSEINAYDGEDLKLIITFGCINNKINSDGLDSSEEEDGFLPHLGLITTIMTILITSLIISGRNNSKGIN